MPANPALGIDFGTSNTTAVLRRSDSRVETVVFDGSPLLPSAVFVETDGTILVGRDAVDSARLDPTRFEPHPKRCVDDGTVLLGDSEIPVVDLFSAVLGRVRRECSQILGAIPSTVAITHPASWGPTRRQVLQEAAREAGFPAVSLVPEPVAAAAYYVAELGNRIPVGNAVVVHDFGGGTFDASVVRRTPGGFEVLAVDGLDDLGGRDIDQAIVNHLRESRGTDAEWERLLRPTTAADRRQWRAFHDDIRAAKERLSRNSNADLYLPVLDREVHLTRQELETLTAPLLARAPGIVKGVIRDSDLPESAIAGVFLVGGASRMPLAATMLHRELGRPPTVIDRLEQVVAHGALLTGAVESAPVEPAPEPYRPVTTQAPPEPYQPVAPQVPHQSVLPAPAGPAHQMHAPDGFPVREPVRPRAAHSVLGMFSAGSAAVPFAIDMYLPGLTSIANELHADPLAAELTLSSFLAGAALGLFATGPLSDRLGRRGPLLIGTALFALASLVAALAPDIAALIGARFVQGLAGAGCMVLIRAVLDDRAGPRLARSLATLGVFLGAASVAAPVLGGAVVFALGWRSVFLILAVIGALASAVVLFGVPETLPRERRGGSSRVGNPPMSRPAAGVTLSASLSAAAMFVCLGGSSVVFMHYYGLSPGMYGLILATNAVGAILGGTLFSTLSRRGKPKRLLYVALALAAIGTFSATGTGAADMTLVWASLFVALFGLGGVTPAMLGVAQGLGLGFSRPAVAFVGGLSCLCGAVFGAIAPQLGPDYAESATPMAIAMLALLALAALALTLTAGKALGPGPDSAAQSNASTYGATGPIGPVDH